MKSRMDHPPPEDKNHRLQSVVLFVLLALCGMVWYTRLSSTTRNLSGQSPSILLRKTVLSLKSPTGAFIAPLRCANANLFNKVQEKLAKNKKAPARHKAEDTYLLTTKLYCGKCGALMFGESGVSHTGKM